MASAGVAICVDESVDDRVVIAALEVIPSRFCLVLVPTMPKTEQFCGVIAAAMERFSSTDSRVSLAQNRNGIALAGGGMPCLPPNAIDRIRQFAGAVSYYRNSYE